MENLTSPQSLHDDKLVSALRPDTKLQMIATDDIGKFGAKAFLAADTMKGAEVDIAGDEVTMPQAAEALSGLVGKKVTYQPIPMDAIRQNSEDLALMLEWFEAVGYSVEIPSLESKWGIRPLTLKDWIRTQRVESTA